MVAPNSILQSRYRIVRELGHGGMGTVYEAVDQRVNCVVALKQTLATRDEEASRAFEREAALLANLRHPALPKVMDYFSENEGDFLVMEFIPGSDLARLSELRGSPFPEAEVLSWAGDLLRVLEYLHSQQPPIVHRDIKPSNLKLTKEGELFLLDFGLAKGSLGQMPTLVTSRSVRGYTPVYAPLEQILGQGTDPRSDIYSVGATLYHLLAGIPPIDAPARYHALEEERPDPLPPIQNVNAQASAPMATLVHKAMEVARKNRFDSASEMLKAVRNAAAGKEQSTTVNAYQQTDANRQQRDGENRLAEEAAAKRDDERRRALEAETRNKSQETEERTAEKQVHLLQTMPAPPPKPFAFDQRSGSEAIQSRRSSKRGRIFAGSALAVVMLLGGGYFVWSAMKSAPQNAATNPTVSLTAAQPSVAPSSSPLASPTPTPAPTPIVPKPVRPPADFVSFARTEAGDALKTTIGVSEVDLNQDGVSELIAQIYVCGSGGCPTAIFRRSGTRFQDISGDLNLYMFRQLDRAQLEAGPGTSKGYLDIKYDRQTFKFDSRKYVCSKGC